MDVSNSTKAIPSDASVLVSQLNGLMPWTFNYPGSYGCKATQSVVAFIREFSFGAIGFTRYNRKSLIPQRFVSFQVLLQAVPDVVCYGDTVLQKLILTASNSITVAVRSILKFSSLFQALDDDIFFSPTLLEGIAAYWHNAWRRDVHKLYY